MFDANLFKMFFIIKVESITHYSEFIIFIFQSLFSYQIIQKGRVIWSSFLFYSRRTRVEEILIFLKLKFFTLIKVLIRDSFL